MPRTRLAATNVPAGGVDLNGALTAANVDGHSLNVTGRETLLVFNGSTAAITVTLVTPGQVQGLDIADRVIPVAAGARQLIPLQAGIYDQPNNAGAFVNFSAVTTVSVALLRA